MSTLAGVAFGLDKGWIITCAGCIFSMQTGLAWLEAGAVRRKNQSSIYWKIIINCMVTIMCWWLIGYALAFGDAHGRFVGGQRFYVGVDWEETLGGHVGQWGHFIFQIAVACVLPAVTCGVVSERITFKACAIHTFFMMVIIYPFIISWTWGEGWLYEEGYRDFTGSGMVHVTAAFAGLACLLVVGPRYNRWGDNHVDVFDKVSTSAAIVHHAPAEKEQTYAVPGQATPTKGGAIPSVAVEAKQSPNAKYVAVAQSLHAPTGQVQYIPTDPTAFTQENINEMRRRVVEESYDAFEVSDLGLVAMGGLFLWFGFQFFNAGSSLFLNDYALGRAAEKGGANTYFAGAGAGLWTLFWKTPIMSGSFSARRLMKDECASVVNGFLAGMVANGAGMDTYEPWESFVVGIIGATFYITFSKIFANRQIDDTLEAFPLHGGGGMAGVLCAPIFSQTNGFFHENSGKYFGWHIIGLLAIAGWSFIISLIVWVTLDKMKILRVDLKTEIVGFDFIDYADDLKFSKELKPNPNFKPKKASWLRTICCGLFCGKTGIPDTHTSGWAPASNIAEGTKAANVTEHKHPPNHA